MPPEGTFNVLMATETIALVWVSRLLAGRARIIHKIIPRDSVTIVAAQITGIGVLFSSPFSILFLTGKVRFGGDGH